MYFSDKSACFILLQKILHEKNGSLTSLDYIPQCDRSGRYNLNQKFRNGSTVCVFPFNGTHVSKIVPYGEPLLYCERELASKYDKCKIYKDSHEKALSIYTKSQVCRHETHVSLKIIVFRQIVLEI